MTTVRAWLPEEIEVPRTLDRHISALVETWSGRWFVANPLAASALAQAARPTMSWRAIDRGVMLGLSDSAPLELGARVAGVPAIGRSGPDRALLEDVAEECLADLCGLLALMTGAPRDSAWGPSPQPSSHVTLVGDGSAPFMAIALTADLFATLARAALPPLPPPLLGNAHDALARTSLCVSAALGRVSLSLSEVEILEIGDVLVLDRSVDAPLSLAVGGTIIGKGSCTVVQAAPPIVKIVETITRADIS